jgi:CRP-like cAMP-binding protein
VKSARELLKQISLFSALSDRDLRDLAQRAQQRRVPAKTVVVSKSATLYAIISGRLKTERTRSGETVLLDVLGPGQVFGELALLTGGTRTANVVALEACELLTIDQRELHALIAGRSELALALLGTTASRIVELTRVVEELHTLCLEPRLASRVCAVAEEHGRRDGGALVVDLRLSQGDWAALTGTNREAVNRQFRSWAKAGWIRLEGQRLFVIDLEALRAAGDRAGPL